MIGIEHNNKVKEKMMKKLTKIAIALFGATTLGFAGFGAYTFADNFWQGHNNIVQINNDLDQLSQTIKNKNDQLTKANQQISNLNNQITDLTNQLNQKNQGQDSQGLSQAIKEAQDTRDHADTVVNNSK